MKQYEPYIKHILEEIAYLEKHSRNLTFMEFVKNETLTRAFVRSLEIIGEAVKNLPLEIRRRGECEA